MTRKTHPRIVTRISRKSDVHKLSLHITNQQYMCVVQMKKNCKENLGTANQPKIY